MVIEYHLIYTEVIVNSEIILFRVYMRLLNRLNQYQRLWQPSAGKPQTVTVSELAERCFCSERHVRTLLRQAQEAGWLEWQAQSGRGKRGQLRFLVTPESLRNAMMEQALETGKQQDVLELAQLAPGELRTLLQPFMGGQWQNDTPTLRIPYYRPLEPLQPGFLPGRAEQHLAGQIFSGLTRFDNNTQRPIGDLAHHWETSTELTGYAGTFIFVQPYTGITAMQ